jgi:cell division protein FtsW
MAPLSCNPAKPFCRAGGGRSTGSRSDAFSRCFAIGILLGFAASPPLAERNGHEPFHYVIRQFAFGGLALSVMVLVSMMSPTTVRRLGVLGFLGAMGALMLLPVFGTDYGQGAVRWYLAGLRLGAAVGVPQARLRHLHRLDDRGQLRDRRPAGQDRVAGVTMVIVGLPRAAARFRAGGADRLRLVGDLFRGRRADADPDRRDRRLWAGRHLRLPEFRAFRPPHRRVPVDEVDPNTQLGFATDAIREGGLFGAGVGEGSVKWTLPDAHTDFIIAVAAEEYGLILVLTIIALFCHHRGALLLPADARTRSVHPAGRHGARALIALQAFINLGVAVRLLPAKGMTLPFVSYGGSSLIATGIAVGMVLCFTRTRPQGDIGDIFSPGIPVTARGDTEHGRTTSDHRGRRHRRAHVPRPGAGRGDGAQGLAGDAVDRCARRAVYRRLSPYGRRAAGGLGHLRAGRRCWPRRWCRSASLAGIASATVTDAARPARGGRGLRRLSRDPGAGRGLADAPPRDPRTERRAGPGEPPLRAPRRRGGLRHMAHRHCPRA